MRAILVTIGSLGDLHPFIAIGHALRARGVDVVLAVPHDHVAKVRAAGLSAAAILPAFAEICAALGIDQSEAAHRVATQPGFVLDAVIMPALSASTAALDDLADDADVIVGSLFALAAGIVAEKRGLPLVAINLQPMALLSAYDPPDTRMLAQAPAGALGRGWNRIMLGAGRAAIRMRYNRQVNRVRRAHGLRSIAATPLFDPVPAQRAMLCCYSPLLATVQPDAPPGTEAIGFPLFDSEDGGPATLHPDLASFLDRGAPPIVFTLGSFMVHAPGDFYAQAAFAARAIGRRAVLLTGGGEGCRDDGDLLMIGYAPHSRLFRRAAAVVHHGGVGTTGQAMHAGIAQLVVPFFGDQFDNAARIVRLGLGLRIRPAAFRRQAAIDALTRLLDDPEIAARAATVAAAMARETPTNTAAARIIAFGERQSNA